VGVETAPRPATACPRLAPDPVLGRNFQPEEKTPGANAVVLVSYRLWEARYGGDPGLVGRTILVEGRSRQVVGVMPRGFRLPTDYGEDAAEPTELWIPLFLDTSQD